MRRSTAGMSDDQTVERLKQRDPEALSLLMDNYASSIYGLIGRIIHSIGKPEDVEECVSDTFVSVWHRIDEYDFSRASLRTWIHIIAKYKALDCRRKLMAAGRTLELPHQFALDDDSLEKTVLLKSELEDVMQQVDRLNKLERDIFYRRYFYYEPLETIARETGLTRKAVENRLRRIRQTLRQQMKMERGEGVSWT